MYNVNEKDELIKVFWENAEKNVEENVTEDILGFMKSGNSELVREYIYKIQNNVIAAIPVNMGVPKVSVYVAPMSVNGEGIDLISMTIKNRIKSDKQFAFKCRVATVEVKEKISDFFIRTYEALLVSDMVEKNLAKVNEVLERATKEAGVGYTVSLVSSLGVEGKKLTYISDDSVVFVADNERALDIDEFTILKEASDEYPQELINSCFEALVKEIAECQTTEQLVANQGALIRCLVNVSKNTLAITLIKKVCSKNVKNITGNKDTFAYYKEDDVYALLARRGGEFEVVLSPFNVKTLRKVDVDVLEKIK